jgi:hypothetical protein
MYGSQIPVPIDDDARVEYWKRFAARQRELRMRRPDPDLGDAENALAI